MLPVVFTSVSRSRLPLQYLSSYLLLQLLLSLSVSLSRFISSALSLWPTWSPYSSLSIPPSPMWSQVTSPGCRSRLYFGLRFVQNVNGPERRLITIHAYAVFTKVSVLLHRVFRVKTAIKQRKGLCWWGHVASGTGETMKYDLGRPLCLIEPRVWRLFRSLNHFQVVLNTTRQDFITLESYHCRSCFILFPTSCQINSRNTINLLSMCTCKHLIGQCSVLPDDDTLWYAKNWARFNFFCRITKCLLVKGLWRRCPLCQMKCSGLQFLCSTFICQSLVLENLVFQKHQLESGSFGKFLSTNSGLTFIF